MTIYFVTPGEFDLRAITDFGVSVKENDNPIGQFGTGLKYAIACLLRNSCSVSIHMDGKTHKMGTVKKEFRGQEFQYVTIGKKVLGYTTALGKNWEPWQAFRELASNTKDEGGFYELPTELHIDHARVPNRTVIAVTGIDHLMDEPIFIDTKVLGEPIAESGRVQVFDRESLWIYYKGVRVAKFEEGKKSLYTYNLINCDLELTEDRVLPGIYDAKSIIETFFARFCENKTIIKDILRAPERTFERSFNFEYDIPGNTFFGTVHDLAFTRNEDCETINKSALKKSAEYSNKKAFDEAVPVNAQGSSQYQKMLINAVSFCNMLGVPTQGIDFRIVERLSGDILAFANVASKKVLLSVKAFLAGQDYLNMIVLEEVLHCVYCLRDESRELQTKLLELVVKAFSVGQNLSNTIISDLHED